MSKQNPVTEHSTELSRTAKLREFLRNFVGAVQRDIEDRSGWEMNRLHYYRRRYALEFKKPTFPWPGSSDIVMPLIDMTIDKLKPLYVGLVTQTNPPVTVLAHDRESLKKISNIELWFDWLVRVGSPNFIREVVLAADDVLESGFCVTKSLWQYETRTTPEVLTYDRLPKRLKSLVVVKKAKEADRLFAEGAGKAVLTGKEFDQSRDVFSDIISLEYQLDTEVPQDKKAHDDILAWLREGAKGVLKMRKRDIVVDAPRMVAINPFDFIVPSSTSDNIEDAERWVNRLYLSDGVLRARARDARWSSDAVNEILKVGTRTGSRQNRYDMRANVQEEAFREGVGNAQQDTVHEIWEAGFWYDYDGDGVDEKVVCVLSPEVPELPLKIYAYRRPSGKWPIHRAEFELNKGRWYAPRGVPEKLDELEKEIIVQHRAKLNAMAINTAKTFKMRTSSGVNVSNMRWIPGQIFPVRNMEDIQEMIVSPPDINLEREEQILRTWAEQYLGSADFGLSNPLSSLTEARTAQEIRAIQASSRQALSLRGELFQLMMGQVYGEMFDLWHLYGPEEVWVRVTDSPPLRLTKEELQGDFVFHVTGTIGETDPGLEAAKALSRIQVLLQAQQVGLGDEFELSLGEALMDWLEKDDIRAARRIVRRRSPEQVNQLRQARAQQEAAEMAARRNEAMDATTLEGALDRIAQKSKKTTGFGKNQQVKP